MVDFFNEVEEDLRAQQLKRLSRYVPWAAGVIGLVFAGALAYAGWTSYAGSQTSAASLAYGKGLKALEAGDKVVARRYFVEAQKPFASGVKALALMQQAGLESTPAAAVADLDNAAKASSDRILSDLASLQAAYRLMDTASYTELEQRLKPLAQAGRPFQALALEALGMVELKAGRMQEAKSNFSAIQLLMDAAPEVRQRASLALETINSGDAARAAEVAKAAAALPPPPPTATSPSAGSPVAQAGAVPQ